MKKSIKETEKDKTSSASNKSSRPFTAKKAGYKEEVYNSEEQSSYNKSKQAKDNKKSTAAPND